MNESIEKFSEQSIVSRALALRAKMATDDLYKKYILCSKEKEGNLDTIKTDFKGWDFDDWDKSDR